MVKKKKTEKKEVKKKSVRASFRPSYFWAQFRGWWRARLWHKIVCVFLALFFLCLTGMYGIAQWYIAKYANQPLQLSATFIPDYAEYFGLSPQDTLNAMFSDLGIKEVRLVSYWSDIEKTPGTYDFSQLDWEFAMAKQYGAKVDLTLGMRQPRWPECHEPDWAMKEPKSQWEPQLTNFIAAVVNRYKNNPQLSTYQLENEFFLKAFGQCTDFDRNRLVSEFNLVKKLDPKHELDISMSNNAIGTPLGQPVPDEWGISIYKRVWDKTITHRYFEYPIPAWYYAFRAGFTLITRGHNSFIHELQTEGWPPEGQGLKDASIAEQNKSLDANRLTSRIQYGEATGMRRIGLWGVEWWYWRKVDKNDPSLWNAGKAAIQKANDENAKLANKN